MSSVNKVILIGNCGRDPETRYAPNGSAVCNVSLATTSKRKDKTTGEIIEDTQWHRVVLYDRLAEVAGEFLKKGRAVYIEGRLKYGKYTDKDGVERATTDVVAFEMQLLGGRDAQDQASAPAAPAPRRPGPPAAPPAAPPGRNRYADVSSGRAPPPARQPAKSLVDMDDDIPF